MDKELIEMKKTTVRIEDNLHKKIMKMLLDKDISFQEYVMNLIDKDMNPNKYPVKGQISIDDLKNDK